MWGKGKGWRQQWQHWQQQYWLHGQQVWGAEQAWQEKGWQRSKTSSLRRRVHDQPWKDTVTVGIYFGTFDPIHENHVGLAKFALERSLAHIVYFAVNGDNPMKPLATPHLQRFHLVQRRLEEEQDSRLRCLQLSPMELADMGWSGRQQICTRARSDVLAEHPGADVEVVQLLGQDSFEQAVSRSSAPSKGRRRAPAGIFSVRGIRFLVFPRGGSLAEPVQVPEQLQRCVTIVEDYADPVSLSSTAVRETASRRGSLAGAVHPRLQEEVAEMYGHGNRFLLLLMGPPGAGKTSLGLSLAQHLGFYHISGGDVFRAANSRASHSMKRYRESQEQIKAKVFAAIARAVSQLAPAPVSFDGFLPKDLQEFEAKVGSIGLLVELECDEKALLARLQRRQSREHDVKLGDESRIRTYKKQHEASAATLQSFDAGRGIVRSLAADGDWEEVFAQLQSLVKEAAQKNRLALPKVELHRIDRSKAGEQRILDDKFWLTILEDIEASPQESYNLRPNANTLKERAGSRALKNINNLVKAVLIDWSLRQVAVASQGQQDLCVEVLDVASGRGGDQLKFGQAAAKTGLRLSYTAIDVAEAQVEEARRRMRLELAKSQKGVASGSPFARARFFIGDSAASAPCTMPSRQPLPWQQVVSAQFALHYFFSSEATAKKFLRNATGRLCSGGVLIFTTVDASKIAQLAEQALASEGFTVENQLFSIAFADEQIAKRASCSGDECGLRYRFALTSEGIDCEEFIVSEAKLRHLLDELDIDLVASVPFSSLADFEGQVTVSSASIAGALLTRLGDSKEEATAYSVYDRLGLNVSRSEAKVVTLYKAYVGRKRSSSDASSRHSPSLADAMHKVQDLAAALGQESDGDLMRDLPALHV
eukprot:TRINITY_DN90756_c0_g1_i1.p1 TRINITY_DN90756_c0_g1~~TRINITY_DN90756_c0_g1_i1.p1  ORF type:complete len:877 (+),score=192.28 TRINITY_DN90756_c0_g1_i1:43-2673(+)